MAAMVRAKSNASDNHWSYLRVAEQIRQEVLAGVYKPGKRLPGEPALARRFGVGRVTIARALQVLQRSNLLFRVQGSGTYIQPDVARGSVRLTIGYLVHDMGGLRNSVGAALLETVQQDLETKGHTVRLLTRSELFAGGMPAATLRRMVRAGTLDGLIVAYSLHPVFARAIGQILPVMYMLNDLVPDGALHVAVDYTLGHFQAARHLLDLGHRRIGLLGGNRTGSIGYRIFQAFRLALQTCHIDPDGCPVVQPGYDPAAQHAAAQAILTDNPDLTALVCADDEAAMAAIAAADRLGHTVPDDLSIVGCNDLPAAAAMRPPLTTLHVDYTQVARQASDLLIGRLFGRPGTTRCYVNPHLVVRGTTARPGRPRCSRPPAADPQIC